MASIDARDRVVREVERSLSSIGVPLNSQLLVAVSGGADSTALLCALRECRRSNLRMTAVHVSHGIRPEADSKQEIAFLKTLCEGIGVELRVMGIEFGRVRALAASEHRSIEEVARSLRYSLLDAAAEQEHAEYIAVGHTRDDQFETAIMRLFQGGLLSGLVGIPSSRGRIIRPILKCTRRDVLAFLDSRGIGHRIDSTNADERYLRNRVRKRIVPAVVDIFPGAISSIEQLTRQVRDLDSLLNTCANLAIPWEVWGEGWRVPAKQFFSAPAELRVRSVLSLYGMRPSVGRIPRRFFERLETERSTRSGGILLEGHGAVVDQTADMVFWRPTVVVETKTSYLIHVFEPNMYHITPALCFTVSTVPKGSAGGRGIGLPESLVRHPLVVRSRKPGDTIHMKEGAKSLKKLFNEWGVAESHRDTIPIVEDRGGIWAVCGQAIGYQDRVRFVEDLPAYNNLKTAEILFAFEKTGDQA